MRETLIFFKWRSQPIRTIKVLKAHNGHVITCLQFCDNRIVSASDDNTLKVWSAVTGKVSRLEIFILKDSNIRRLQCLQTLIGHEGGVWSTQMAGNCVISGSTDQTLKVWDADTGLCKHTMKGHSSTVRCMKLHGNMYVLRANVC